MFRRRRLLMFFEKGFCKGSQFHRKTPELESLINKVVGVQACNVIKKRPQNSCFPVKFAKFLRITFFTEHPRWLLLDVGSLI